MTTTSASTAHVAVSSSGESQQRQRTWVMLRRRATLERAARHGLPLASTPVIVFVAADGSVHGVGTGGCATRRTVAYAPADLVEVRTDICHCGGWASLPFGTALDVAAVAFDQLDAWSTGVRDATWADVWKRLTSVPAGDGDVPASVAELLGPLLAEASVAASNVATESVSAHDGPRRAAVEFAVAAQAIEVTVSAADAHDLVYFARRARLADSGLPPLLFPEWQQQVTAALTDRDPFTVLIDMSHGTGRPWHYTLAEELGLLWWLGGMKRVGPVAVYTEARAVASGLAALGRARGLHVLTFPGSTPVDRLEALATLWVEDRDAWSDPAVVRAALDLL